MVEITNDDLNNNWQVDRDLFREKLIQTLYESYPELREIYLPERFSIMVDYAIDRAVIANNIRDDLNIEIFVDIMFNVGPNFDQYPKIQKILHNGSIPIEKRWDILLESDDPELDAEWESADDIYNLCEWHAEGRYDIKDVYPTTYMMPGYIKLYEKWHPEFDYINIDLDSDDDE